MEGFNGKVRWLIKQAFGFRDFKYFELKIFDLPNTNTAARLQRHNNERREPCENHPPAHASFSIAEEP